MQIFLLCLFVFPAAVNAAYRFSEVARIVAVGDLHGDYEQYVKVLTINGLIDEKQIWIGGETHLVQLGDITDRGPDSLKIAKHLMKLEKQARKSGGQVHVLIGNHEAMNIEGDLRYVDPGEYSVLVTNKSEAKRTKYADRIFAHRLESDPELINQREETFAQILAMIPLGYVEHRVLWQKGGKLAKWVTSHNTVVAINRTLFVHGGLNPHDVLPDLGDLNRQMSRELSMSQQSSLLGQELLSEKDDGPLWYRGLARHTAEVELDALIAMLEHYEADRIVVAHTPTIGAVMTRFDSRVVIVDVGLSKSYGANMANLLIVRNAEADTLYAIHRGQQVPLPDDAGLAAYLNKVRDLEPGETGLVKRLAATRSTEPVIEAVNEAVNEASED